MRLIKFLILICFLACNTSDQSGSKDSATVTNPKQDSSEHSTTRAAAKSIEEVADYPWRGNGSDTAQYLCELHFRDEYAMNFFHRQCIYFFFTHTYSYKAQEVHLEWTYKTDCISDMSFLEKANGAKRRPKYGDLFAIYRLINDTTLSVEYKFPQWVEKANQIAHDSLFPQRLYLKDPNE